MKIHRFRFTGSCRNASVAALCIGIIAGLSGPTLAATFCVSQHKPGCATTIGAAVSAAAAGDTVRVSPGTYKEEVTITKPLILIGTSNQGVATIIDATGLAHAIYVSGVTTGPVVVQQFTAENANREGILVENSTTVTITGNTVADNDKSLNGGKSCAGAFPFDQDDCGEGLHLRATADSIVSNNTVENNAGGILLTDETGANHDNVVTGNLVQNNVPDCGITLPSHPPCMAGSNDIDGCIGGPQIGTPSSGVFNNVVSRNVSSGNGAAGTGIFAPTPGTAAYSNTVIDNVLTGNGNGGVVMHSHSPGQNLNNNVIADNTISGNGGDPDSEGASPAPVGIVVFSNAASGTAPITGTTISRNTISDEAVDVWVGTTATNLSLHLNNLLGDNSVVGVDNAGTGTVDATSNYWGCSDGPGSSNCSTTSGTVLSVPFLSSAVKQ